MKLAMIGTGKIVHEAMPAVEAAGGIEMTAVFGRAHSREKAEELARAHGIGAVYTDYDKLLAEADADFCYIGLANVAHYEYTKKALLAGKHVILEKPFAASAEEAEELIDLAREKHLYLFEAVTPLHTPNFAALSEALPALGQVRAIQANYSQYSSRYDKYLKGEVLPAFDPNCAGGALYDINIYNLNIIVALFGEPEGVSYTPNFGFNGIDTSGALVLSYPGFFATAVGAKDADSPSFVLIQGEKGWARVEGAPNEFKSLIIHAGGEEREIRLNKYEHRMVHEFKEFARVYEAGDYATMDKWLDTSLAVAEVAERARLKAGIVFPTDAEG